MAQTASQTARNRLAAASRRGEPAEVIGQLRSDLEFAKAQQAIRAWQLMFSPIQRASLAAQLAADCRNVSAT